ncbi:MAG: hypothetical protein U1C46_06850 [Bacteroidales bacterium]|nr:hypothetical protein [Bacteroidales bacterium]MDZ4204520.1 hypothetical protein [Bacteroidales bacterium]
MATTRIEERIACSLGQGASGLVHFEEGQSLDGGGVLFLLPALLAQGLLKTKEVYAWSSKFYYSLESIVLTLAFMALLRIKNPEQLKQCKPGELGRIIGLDRVPEVKCLRSKIELLTRQQQATHLNTILVDSWYSGDSSRDAEFLYIDGHVRIYYGDKANLPVKYISRQKLCLSATTEYWVNDAKGLPVMMVMGELTEKLQTVIEHQIIPELQKTILLSRQPTFDNTPVCTFIFDREAYEPAFFRRLWEKHKIAIVTYRKNVKDKWPDDCFKSFAVTVLQQTVNMQLCEQGTSLGGYWFREIRRQGETGHQTSIITTHPTLESNFIAGRMFGRWSQENFFRYLIEDYDFDKMVSFGIEPVDPEKEIVNPPYRKLTHQIKKLREKIQRLEARFFPLIQLAIDQPLDNLPAITNKQMEYKEKIDFFKNQEAELINQRSQIKPRLKVCQMPQQQRYNKLKTESKLLMNVIKMVCYRAESSVAQWIAPYLAKAENEKRMVVKQIIQSNADLTPDYEMKSLKVTLHSLSAARYNKAADELVKLLNQTETIFPGTDLKMIFEITA